MGRPPIGARAMTTAERVRRYWFKKAAPEQLIRIAELEKKLAQAHARIEALRSPRTKTARRRTKET
jgi:hypothetical protein